MMTSPVWSNGMLISTILAINGNGALDNMLVLWFLMNGLLLLDNQILEANAGDC